MLHPWPSDQTAHSALPIDSGLSVTGNVAPDIVKPVPVSAAELIVAGAVPVDVNVTGCVDAVFTVTLPNVRLAALTVNCGFDRSRAGATQIDNRRAIGGRIALDRQLSRCRSRLRSAQTAHSTLQTDSDLR